MLPQIAPDTLNRPADIQCPLPHHPTDFNLHGTVRHATVACKHHPERPTSQAAATAARSNVLQPSTYPVSSAISPKAISCPRQSTTPTYRAAATVPADSLHPDAPSDCCASSVALAPNVPSGTGVPPSSGSTARANATTLICVIHLHGSQADSSVYAHTAHRASKTTPSQCNLNVCKIPTHYTTVRRLPHYLPALYIRGGEGQFRPPATMRLRHCSTC